MNKKYKPGVVSVEMIYKRYNDEDQFNYGTSQPEMNTYETYLIDDVWINDIDQYMSIQTNSGTFYIPYKREEDLNKLYDVCSRLNRYRRMTETIGYGVKIYIDMVGDRIMNTKFVLTSRDETLPSGEVMVESDVEIHHWYYLNKSPADKGDGMGCKKKILIDQLGKYRDTILKEDKLELSGLNDFIDFLLRLKRSMELEKSKE